MNFAGIKYFSVIQTKNMRIIKQTIFSGIKKIGLAIASLAMVPMLVFAQNNPIAMPAAGLTPDDSFYFIDILAEKIEYFFTFGAEKKARLQMEFAAERVAEIKDMLEKKGVDAKGIPVAELKLEENLTKANEIMENEKTNGKDVSGLADKLSEDNEVIEDAVDDIFETHISIFEDKKNNLENEQEKAMEAGDDSRAGKVEMELEVVNNKMILLEDRAEAESEIMREGEVPFYKSISDEQKAVKRIRMSESEKNKVVRSENSKKIKGPAEDFSRADDLLSRSKAEFEKKNFAESARLAMLSKVTFEIMKAKIDDGAKRADRIAKGRERELELNDRRQAENRMRDTDRQRSNTVKQAERRSITIPADIIAKGDSLLASARSEFERSNSREAERLARGAKNIFLLLRANFKTLDKMRDDFEIEIERERIEIEIERRMGDRINARIGEIRNDRKAREVKVTAETLGNASLGRIEVRFNSGKAGQNEVAQEILSRMKLTKDEISRLLVIQVRRQDDLRDRLEAKVRVRKMTTEAEAKLRTVLNTTDRARIIDGIFARVQALTVQDIINAMEFRDDNKGTRTSPSPSVAPRPTVSPSPSVSPTPSASPTPTASPR